SAVECARWRIALPPRPERRYGGGPLRLPAREEERHTRVHARVADVIQERVAALDVDAEPVVGRCLEARGEGEPGGDGVEEVLDERVVDDPPAAVEEVKTERRADVPLHRGDDVADVVPVEGEEQIAPADRPEFVGRDGHV